MEERKVALITGASSGIGRAIAITLAKAGYNIIVNYASNDTAAEQVKEEVEATGVSCELLKANVGNFKEVEAMMGTAFDFFGKIHVLVNNAGITKDQLVLRMTEQEFDDVIDVNLKGTFNCIKHISKKMLKQREGVIINISSVIGLTGNVGQSNYAASKAGLIGMTKSMAKEFAPRNIRVNAVAPGFIQTKMTDKIPENIRNTMIDNIPLKALGTTEDVANTVEFLVSDKAKYITGQVITVDGGMTI